MSEQFELVVAWHGLPAYAARLMLEGRKRMGYDFPVLATKPDVPIEGMETILGEGIYWIDPKSRPSWVDLGLKIPKIFIHTGWGYAYFLSLADEVRAQGGQVVGMFDNCWKGNLRQLVGGLYFRAFKRKQYAAAWVPGKSARRLCRYIGFKSSRIFTGMYGSDPEVFGHRTPILKRPKQIVFVGRLNHRKGVLELVDAFLQISEDFPDWKLVIVGDGALEPAVKWGERVTLIPFQQPHDVAVIMNQSRVFALASREEHWGLVVHEAALCGCVLALQASIGAVADLSSPGNAVYFKETEPEVIAHSLREIMNWTDAHLADGSQESRQLAGNFGPKSWAENLKEIVSILGHQKIKSMERVAL